MAPGADALRGKQEPSGSGRDRRKMDPAPTGRNVGPPSRPLNQEELPVPSLQARMGLMGELSEAPLSFIRADSMSRKDDDRSDYRKRTASGTYCSENTLTIAHFSPQDRDHEMQDAGNATPPKRPRTQPSTGAGPRPRGHRDNNYAKRTLPIDPSASDRNSRR